MTSNESSRVLPTTNHTQYQSIGPSDLEEPKYFRYRMPIIGFVVIVSILFSGAIVYGLTTKEQKTLYNNGTHTFAPTVIFVSLDGVVNHDLDLHVTPTLTQLAEEGIRAEYMTPSFPPITFPNHWSLVTGLYPEAHGVVGNYFYDASYNDSFYYKSPEHSWDEKWWGGEPIWITAVRQGQKSGVIMWPGCSTEFNKMRPTYSVPYSDYVTFDEKVDQVFDWFDLPLEDRPQFIGLYVPQIDQAGHAYGPYANETMKQLKLADQSIARLLNGLDERNLTDIVNVMIVSDHGMSESDKSRLIYYDDVLTPEELSLIWRIEGEPTLGIRIRPDVDEATGVEILYQAFKRLQKSFETPHFEVYKRQDFPERFHFKNNIRIAPLLVLPDPGWNFVTHKKYDPNRGVAYQPKGVHGYDNLSPESRAIFVARGPNLPKGGKIVSPFWNVELFNVMARILDLKPTNNNNTLNGIFQLET
ncbi:alkaline-phosphatase-like protein [Choanephora cucurbitarum]|nr:alkaline-phosphatase-like protein [Choanephora cucurbitarum]KAI8379927.1 alkaline-phosphatase-like protein [Choanephora cucurbitarum]